MNVLKKVTLQSMKQNRVRTFMTILGIALSVALFTAVISLVGSMASYLKRGCFYVEGNIQAYIENASFEWIVQLQNDSRVAAVSVETGVGYARVDTMDNKPYIYVGSVNASYLEDMPLHLTDGRMPRNEQEIIVSESFLCDWKEKTYFIGSTITLELGHRYKDGEITWTTNGITVGGDGEPIGETLENTVSRTFTIVGTFDQLSYVYDNRVLCYTAFTYEDKSSNEEAVHCAYIRLQNPRKDFSEFQGEYENLDGFRINWDILMFDGIFQMENEFFVYFMMIIVLIIIIFISSVLMIYNAFSISVNERTKEFGILTSVGATKKQMRSSVWFEAALLCSVSIPLGIAVGLILVKIMLIFLQDFVKTMFLYEIPGARLELVISLNGILLSVFLAVLMVILSAWVPVRRAMKITAIEAIRQTQDIQEKKRNKKITNVRVSKLNLKLFGMEGALAKKYYKRSKKKYKTTIISLVISIVLFIGSSALCEYVLKFVMTNVGVSNYDVSCMLNSRNYTVELLEEFRQLEVVEDVAYNCWQKTGSPVYTSLSQLDSSYLNWLAAEQEYREKYPINLLGENVSYDNTLMSFEMCIDDVTYEKLLKENNISLSREANTVQGILINHMNILRYFYDADGRAIIMRSSMQVFKEKQNFLYVAEGIDWETLENLGWSQEDYWNGRYEIMESSWSVLEDKTPIYTDTWISKVDGSTFQTQEQVREIFIAGIIDEVPFGVSIGNGDSLEYLLVLYPYSAFSSEEKTGTLYFKTSDSNQLIEDVRAVLKEHGILYTRNDFTDQKSIEMSARNMVIVIRISVYAFILLISAIALANAFNTISTNLMLRKRDFAMLQSLGMSKAQMNRMLDYECLLYGSRALIWGLALSFLVTYGIYWIITKSIVMEFMMPWWAVIVAVFGVFAIVYLSMRYAKKVMQQEMLMEVLRREYV